MNLETLPFALGIVTLIIFIRFIQLKISKTEITPLLFIAPRGLITIMLFLSIPISKKINFINDSLLIQVIIIGAFLMMIGLMFTTEKADTLEKNAEV